MWFSVTITAAGTGTFTQDDEVMVSSGTLLSACKVQAVLLRMCEKKLLQEAALFAREQMLLIATTSGHDAPGIEQNEDTVGVSIQGPGRSPVQEQSSDAGGVAVTCAAVSDGSHSGKVTSNTTGDVQ